MGFNDGELITMIGIIVNPDSGKDIRRIVAHAIDVTDQQKLNILIRLLRVLLYYGVKKIQIMPDRFSFGRKAIDACKDIPDAGKYCQVLDVVMENEASDTLRATREFRSRNASCIVVLGGDGTNRIVSKACGDIPIISISTGTNNVIPEFNEGTSAGIAAAFIALTCNLKPKDYCQRYKWFEVFVNGQSVDRALVDIGVIRGCFVGTRAVWEPDWIDRIFVTQARPDSTGLSSIVGVVQPVSIDDPWGATLELIDKGRHRVTTFLVPGTPRAVHISSIDRLEPDLPYVLRAHQHLILALDGEREIVLSPGDEAQIILRLNGPYVVNIRQVLNYAVNERFFIDATN